MATAFYIDAGKDKQPNDKKNSSDEHGKSMISSGNPAYRAVGQWPQYG